jgi:hypothetical protein
LVDEDEEGRVLATAPRERRGRESNVIFNRKKLYNLICYAKLFWISCGVFN